MLDGRLFHTGTGTHIPSLNKLRSSSVNNESPLSVAEQISEKNEKKYDKKSQANYVWSSSHTDTKDSLDNTTAWNSDK